MRSFFKGVGISVGISLYMVFLLLQLIHGPVVYQVQQGRLKYCIVVSMPGYEPYFDFGTGQVETDFKFARRYRISPWFDSGPSTTPIDNP